MSFKKTVVLFAMITALFALCSVSAYAYGEDRDYYQSNSYRESQQREQDYAERLHRETRQRDEDYHRQQEQYRQERHRADELRTYSRTDRDGRIQTCNSTQYQTVCN